jgi:hypothetical protein
MVLKVLADVGEDVPWDGAIAPVDGCRCAGTDFLNDPAALELFTYLSP